MYLNVLVVRVRPLQCVGLVVHIVRDVTVPLSADRVRHRSGQRDHGHPGSGGRPGGHEKASGAHGGGHQSLWTARHRRGPGVCLCVTVCGPLVQRECGNFNADQLTAGFSSLHLPIAKERLSCGVGPLSVFNAKKHVQNMLNLLFKHCRFTQIPLKHHFPSSKQHV